MSSSALTSISCQASWALGHKVRENCGLIVSSFTCKYRTSQLQTQIAVITLLLRMAASETLTFVSGLDMDQHRLKSLSGTDVRYLISYFLRKMSLIAWIVVNISFNNSSTAAMVNKCLRRSVFWYCAWFLIHLNVSVEESRYLELLLVTALVITKGSLWREPNVLNSNKHSQLHPGL